MSDSVETGVEAEAGDAPNPWEGLRRLVRLLFRDLVPIARDEPEVFNDLFYDREHFLTQFTYALANVRHHRENILVTAGAGVGKSTFVYKVLLDHKFMGRHKLYPIFVDYRTSLNIDETLISFVKQCETYFHEIGYPIKNLVDNTVQNVPTNRAHILSHLTDLPVSDDIPFLFVFLDDLDYIHDEKLLFGFLEAFIGFAASRHCSLILTARPPLFNAVNTYDDRMATYVTRGVERIKLKPVDPYELIARRLALVLEEGANPFRWLVPKWLRRESAFQRWLATQGVDDVTKLPRIALPFDRDFCNFMTRMTNGNIREMLDIAERALNEILERRAELPRIEEDYQGETVERVAIPESVLCEMFLDGGGEEPRTFRMINLHQYLCPQMGNSLLLNVLEGVALFQCVSDDFFDEMERLGHSRERVDWALTFLQEKVNRMIAPKGLYPERERAELFPQFEITEKGEFYMLHIRHWAEYTTRFPYEGASLMSGRL